jgi:hypothetical protein
VASSGASSVFTLQPAQPVYFVVMLFFHSSCECAARRVLGRVCILDMLVTSSRIVINSTCDILCTCFGRCIDCTMLIMDCQHNQLTFLIINNLLPCHQHHYKSECRYQTMT